MREERQEEKALRCAQHIIKTSSVHADEYRDSWFGGESHLAKDYMRLRVELAELQDEKRHNISCVKWIANAFCDEHGNPRADMPLWAHAVTDTLLLGLTPADAVVEQMKREALAAETSERSSPITAGDTQGET